MTQAEETPAIDTPLEVEPADRAVVITVPSDGEVTLTAEAAERSAIRLLDAADQSRKPDKRAGQAGRTSAIEEPRALREELPRPRIVWSGIERFPMYKLVLLTTAALAISLPATALAQNGRGNDDGDRGKNERGRDDDRGGRGQQNRDDDGDRGRGNGRGGDDGDRGRGNGNRDDDRPVVVVRDGRVDRDVVRNLERNVRRDVERDVERRVLNTDAGRVIVLTRDRGLIAGCPPGLAKKDNGCLPPGQARRIERARYDYLWGSRDDDFDYRYDDGYLYRLNRQGSLLGYVPVLGGALSMGNVWPGRYDYQPVPRALADYYGLTDRYDYRYADGAVYGLDPRTQAISQVAALLTGQQINVGQPMPSGYDVYNVPYAYRDQYADTADARYRYNDGQVYQIDPTTQLVQAVIQLLT